MTMSLIVGLVLTVAMSAGGGFGVVAWLNEGTSSVKIENRSFLVGSATAGVTAIVAVVLYLSFWRHGSGPSAPDLFQWFSIGCILLCSVIGGVTGHVWHELWEHLTGC